MKATDHSISPYLEILFSKCMQEGVFPDSYKIAQVIPLYVGKEKTKIAIDLFPYFLLLVKFWRNF